MNIYELFFPVWLGLRYILIALILLYLISNLDDLFIDLYGLVGRWLNRLRGRPAPSAPTRETLNSVSEKPIAILIPAWREAGVIGPMLRHTRLGLVYSNYHIFVGVYPNDLETTREVEEAAELFLNLHAIPVPSPGPTSKADCLNEIYKGILQFENTNKVRFEIFVLHDANDVVHPLSLKYFNYFIPGAQLVQLPILAYERNRLNGVNGLFLDELAESQWREQPAREKLCGTVMAPGTGTALSSEAINFLAQRGNYHLFDAQAALEVNQAGRLLRQLPGKKIFLCAEEEREAPLGIRVQNSALKNRIHTPVATYQLFPQTLREAIRLKTKWIRGTALQGGTTARSWSPADLYFNWRDRKVIITNLAAGLAAGLLLYELIRALIGITVPDSVPPTLLESHEVYVPLIWAVVALLIWRGLARAWAVGRIYGSLQALWSLPRQVQNHGINFLATLKAIQEFIQIDLGGRTPDAVKHAHIWPHREIAPAPRPRLGDLLLGQRRITAPQLEDALQRQKETEEPLGQILVQSGALPEEDLVLTLAEQHAEQAIEVDPYATSPEVLSLVPRSLAERYRIFPLGTEGETIILASDVTNRDQYEDELSLLLGRPVEFRWTSSADIQFAIERGYAREDLFPTNLSERLGPRLLREGVVSEPDLKRALRKQKRTNQKLGEILLEMNLVTEKQLQKFLGAKWVNAEKEKG